jgi:mRNA-degrading endonuclease RelE of RelBE toxin-antitoxin system
MKYAIETSVAAEQHLDELPAFDRKRILETIEEQLSYQPLTPTRNRKELRPNPLANWALRVGKFRVLYNASEEEGLIVIVAVASKERDKFIIGGKEYDL